MCKRAFCAWACFHRVTNALHPPFSSFPVPVFLLIHVHFFNPAFLCPFPLAIKQSTCCSCCVFPFGGWREFTRTYELRCRSRPSIWKDISESSECTSTTGCGRMRSPVAAGEVETSMYACGRAGVNSPVSVLIPGEADNRCTIT